MTDRLPAVEPDARDIVAAVRAFIDQIRADVFRMQMQASDAEKGIYAVVVLEKLFPAGVAPLAAAHDALGAVLNDTCPDAPPIISLSTERPA